MSENIQKSPSLNQMVDAFTHLKQCWLENFKRQVQNSKNQEVRKEYFRTLAQVIEAENALRHVVKSFTMIVTVRKEIPDYQNIHEKDHDMINR